VSEGAQSLGHKTVLKVAHNLGMRAWATGEARRTNPYVKRKRPREWQAWTEGYDAARKESER